ncbi:MAG: LysR family transcriptional regulator [Myxococcota bacterium]
MHADPYAGAGRASHTDPVCTRARIPDYAPEMSVEQLQTVVGIAEEGALGRAARRLRFSEPPMTRRLAALEDELGVRLFERLPRGMRPTPAGEALLGYARRILAAIDEARIAVAPAPGSAREPSAPEPDEG